MDPSDSFPDSFITDCALLGGRTRFRLDGDRNAPAILLIHGATVPHWSFDRLMPHLCAAGLQVARYDLLGHGESDRPRRAYRHDLFVEQARELFDWAGLDPQRTAVLGYSMGAAVAASLAARVRPKALVLMAPMLDFSRTNPFSRLLALPVLGPWFMATLGRRALIRRRVRRYRAIGQPELIAKFVEQGARPGFWRALASMERHGALGDQAAAYRAAAATGLRPLILRGANDAIIPLADVERIAELFDQTRRIELDGLEHNLMLTAPEQVAAVVVQALRDGGLIDESPERVPWRPGT